MKLKYSKHIKERMGHRGISPSDIVAALKQGTYLYIGNLQFKVTHENFIVIVEEPYQKGAKKMNLVSVYYKQEFRELVILHSRKHRISFRKAALELRGRTNVKKPILEKHRELSLR